MANRWYVYVDDVRIMDEEFRQYLRMQKIIPITIRDYDCVIAFLEDMRGNDIYIDLDHDLGESGSGYDICKYIVENNYPLVGFHIHSMNPVGAENMRQLLEHYGYLQI